MLSALRKLDQLDDDRLELLRPFVEQAGPPRVVVSQRSSLLAGCALVVAAGTDVDDLLARVKPMRPADDLVSSLAERGALVDAFACDSSDRPALERAFGVWASVAVDLVARTEQFEWSLLFDPQPRLARWRKIAPRLWKVGGAAIDYRFNRAMNELVQSIGATLQALHHHRPSPFESVGGLEGVPPSAVFPLYENYARVLGRLADREEALHRTILLELLLQLHPDLPTQVTLDLPAKSTLPDDEDPVLVF